MGRYYDDELYHHGIKGQRWGIRRFQNPDGSLKAAGAKRYGVAQDRANRAASEARTAHKLADKYTNAMNRKAAKRQAQADANPKSGIKRDKANRAQQEAATAKKLAGKYTSAMDAKAAKRQSQADEAARGNAKVFPIARKQLLKLVL